LNYLDDNNKQIGGKLKVMTHEFNISMLRSFSYLQFGYFTHDKLVFAKFNTHEDILEDGERLSDVIKDDITNTNIVSIIIS
jgi:hypothetical protein